MKLEELGFLKVWKDDKNARYEKKIWFFGNFAQITIIFFHNDNPSTDNNVRVELEVNGEAVRPNENQELLSAILQEAKTLGWEL